MALVPFSHASPFHNSRRLSHRQLDVAQHTVTIQQEWKDDGRGGTKLGFGAVVYEASIVLSKMLEKHPHWVEGKKVLELGCGPGLVSIVAALLNAKQVLATDGDPKVVALAQCNIEANGVTSTCQACPYLWGADMHGHDAKSIEVVLAADVVACPYEQSFSDLLDTFDHLANPNTHILLAYKKRHGSEDAFFRMLDIKFTCQSISIDTQLNKEFEFHHIRLLKISRRQP